MATHIEKDEACKKHEKLIKAIYYIGNKVMLQSQLYEVLDIIYGQTKYSIDKAIEELVTLKIIKDEQYLDTKYKLIILKKHAIKFVENKATTQEVAAVPKKSTERALYSVVKTDMFIDIFKKYKGKEMNLGWCKRYLDLKGSSIMYHKNQGLRYLENAVSNKDSYNKNNDIINRTSNNKEVRDINLAEGSKSRLGKGTQGKERISIENKDIEIDLDGKAVTRMEQEVNKANIDTILNGNIFVRSIEKQDGKTNITLELHDINNTQNHNRFIEKALVSGYVFSKMFDGPIVINFKIKLLNQVAVNRTTDLYNTKEKGHTSSYWNEKINSFKKATALKESIYQECGFGESNKLLLAISSSSLTKYRNYGD